MAIWVNSPVDIHFCFGIKHITALFAWVLNVEMFAVVMSLVSLTGGKLLPTIRPFAFKSYFLVGTICVPYHVPFFAVNFWTFQTFILSSVDLKIFRVVFSFKYI